jgi:hypothetical protein
MNIFFCLLEMKRRQSVVFAYCWATSCLTSPKKNICQQVCGSSASNVVASINDIMETILKYYNLHHSHGNHSSHSSLNSYCSHRRHCYNFTVNTHIPVITHLSYRSQFDGNQDTKDIRHHSIKDIMVPVR